MVYGIVFSRYPMADSFRLIITKNLPIFVKKINRPSPHYAPVSKHKEMRPRLGWTISYKSLYFVHPSLDLMPLFTGMRERSITTASNGKQCFVLLKNPITRNFFCQKIQTIAADR